MKAIWDNIRGLDLLETLPFVRRGAYGTVGHSLGGHNSVYTAVFESVFELWSRAAGWIRTSITKTATFAAGPANATCPITGIPGIGSAISRSTSTKWSPRLRLASADQRTLKDENFKWQSVDRIVAAAGKSISSMGNRKT